MESPQRRRLRMRPRDWIPSAVLAALCAAMALAPSAATVVRDDGVSMRARVVSTDDSQVSLAGLVEYGTQHLEVEMLEGPAKGSRFRAENELRAQLDIDKKFAPGDTATVTWPVGGANAADTLVARDHWRLGWAFALFAAFAALLVAFGGATGAKALFSFVFSCLAVWKLLVPLCLNGWNAGWTSFAVVSALSAVILYLVAGGTRAFAAALLGSVLGVAASLVLAHVFAAGMHVTGATMPFVQALFYAGYNSLDIADLYCGAVILGASGAVMDLSMDIAAGLAEIARHRPDLPRRALFHSGMRIGRADDDDSLRLFRRLPHADHGLRRAGDAAGRLPELDAGLRRAGEDPGRQLRAPACRPDHGSCGRRTVLGSRRRAQKYGIIPS